MELEWYESQTRFQENYKYLSFQSNNLFVLRFPLFAGKVQDEQMSLLSPSYRFEHADITICNEPMKHRAAKLGFHTGNTVIRLVPSPALTPNPSPRMGRNTNIQNSQLKAPISTQPDSVNIEILNVSSTRKSGNRSYSVKQEWSFRPQNITEMPYFLLLCLLRWFYLYL